MSRRRVATLIAAVCASAAVPLRSPVTPAHAATKVSPAALLNRLVEVPETPSPAPARFGDWAPSSVKKCRTLRAQVLAADAIGATPKNCSTKGLRWTDPFTGSIVSSASTMVVERLIPLQEAWDSGASQWDARTQAAFANDIAFDSTLMAVSARSVAKRKNREPAQWLPSGPQPTVSVRAEDRAGNVSQSVGLGSG